MMRTNAHIKAVSPSWSTISHTHMRNINFTWREAKRGEVSARNIQILENV